MTDQRFTELLGKQLAGELSPEESTEFKTLLASNESYQQEYQSLNALSVLVDPSRVRIARCHNRYNAR